MLRLIAGLFILLSVVLTGWHSRYGQFL